MGFNAFALEIKDYPIINGLVLPAKPTFDQWSAYFFNLALVIGIIAAVGVIIFAGVRFLFSKGNTGRTESSKSMMFRALMGLVVLFGAVLILNTINSNIAMSKIKQIKVGENLDGIVLTESKPDGSEEVWINRDISNIDYPVTGIRWLSNAEDLPAIFVYPQADFKGTPTEIKNGGSASIGKGQSFILDWRKIGVYLYDDVDLKLKNRPRPLALFDSQPALTRVNFDSITNSIKINNPQTTGVEGYGAIIFSEPEYQGKCAWLTESINNLGEANANENKPTKVSSIYVFRTTTESGSATFYSYANCQEAQIWDVESKQEKPNYCTSGVYNTENKFIDACSSTWQNKQKGPTIVSVKLADGAIALLKDKNGNCQIFKKQGIDTCVSTVKYGNVYNPDNNVWPASFTLLQGK